jgi:hypothetical protein
MKLSLLARIFIALGIITAASLLFVWFVIRPDYEESILTERIATLQQLQRSSINNLDHMITGWSNVARFVASQVTERPNEGETILRMTMSLHPEIIQVRISSNGLSDELMSQNILYPVLNINITDSMWIPSKVDSTLHIAWLHGTDSTIQMFAVQAKFQVQKFPFVLRIVGDAKQLNAILSEQAFDKDQSVSIYGTSGIILQNSSSFKLDRPYGAMEMSNSVQSIQGGTNSWRVLSSAFQSLQLWMSIAVPEKTLLKPVEDFLLYSASLILGLMFIMAIFGWWVSHQMKKFIETMKTFYNSSGI